MSNQAPAVTKILNETSRSPYREPLILLQMLRKNALFEGGLSAQRLKPYLYTNDLRTG
jgi:hypothetical protein